MRGWTPVVASLPLLSILIGCALGCPVCYLNQGFYIRHLQGNHGKAVPEARLPVMMIGSLALPAGSFIFAWTSPANIHWIGTCVGGVLIGLGVFCIFQGSTNYLVDTFGKHGASAVAANTMMRNAFAGSFPLFTRQMFGILHLTWGASLLGFLSVALIPIPLIFYVFGKTIRARGRYSKGSTL